MFNKKTAYAPLSPQEMREKETRKKESQKQIEEIRKAASACLGHELFRDYADRIQNAKFAILGIFLSIDAPDPMQEWKAFKQLQCELSVLSSLLNDVKNDAARESKSTGA